MTKRTENLILSVFKYCLEITLEHKQHGVFTLERHIHGHCCLTRSGDILFNKKIDKFLYWNMRFIVDDGYTSTMNKNLLKSFSKMSSRRTKLALHVASLCIDEMMNNYELDIIFIDVCSLVGVKLYNKLYDIKFEQERKFIDGNSKLILTEEQKKRIEELNVFLKMKEEECSRIVQQKYDRLCEIQKTFPEFKDASPVTTLVYKSEKYRTDLGIHVVSIRTIDKESSFPLYIGDIKVCDSLHQVWRDCDSRIEKLMSRTKNIPKQLGKNLYIHSSVDLKWDDGFEK